MTFKTGRFGEALWYPCHPGTLRLEINSPPGAYNQTFLARGTYSLQLYLNKSAQYSRHKVTVPTLADQSRFNNTGCPLFNKC